MNATPKRPRISETDAQESPQRKPPSTFTPHSVSSPLIVANEAIDIAAVSRHGVLQQRLRTLGEEVLNLLTKLEKQSINLKKLSDPTYIARSLRFQFNLSGSARIADTEAFKQLQEATAAPIAECQQKLMAIIRQTTELDIRTIQHVITLKIVEETIAITKMHAVTLEFDSSWIGCLSLGVIQHLATYEILHLSIDTASDHLRTIFPQMAESNVSHNAAYSIVYSQLRTLFLQLLLEPIRRYHAQVKFNKQSQLLQDIDTKTITEKASMEVEAALLKDAASEGHETLNKLIQEKVTSSTAALKREIKTLRSQLKGPRGANTTPGAPSPKKLPSPRTQRTPSQSATNMQRSPRRRNSSPRPQRRQRGHQGPIDTNPRRSTPKKLKSPRRNHAPPDGTNNAAKTDNKTKSPRSPRNNSKNN